MIAFLSLLAPALGQTFTSAAVPDVNAQYFRPSLDATRTFWTDETAIPSQLLTPKLLLHYTEEPLIYTFASGAEVPLVSGVAQTDLILSAAYDRVRIGVDVPIYLVAVGEQASGEFGLGDLAVDGKVLALSEDDGPLGVAFSGRLFLPTATVANALGAPNVGWEIAGIVDKRVLDDRGLLAANVAFRGGPNTELENVRLDDFLAWRAGAAYDVQPRLALSAELVGSYDLPGGGSEVALPVEALFGAHFLSDDVNLRLGAGPGLSKGIGAPDWRVMLAIDAVGAESDPDTDGDGLADSVDACPNEPEDVDTVQDDDGCIDPPTPVVVRVVDPAGEEITGASVALSAGETAAGDGKTGAEFLLEPGAFAAAATAEGYRPGEARFDVGPVEPGKDIVIELVPIGGTVTVRVVDSAGDPVEADIRVAGKPVASGAAWEGERVPGEVRVAARALGYKAAKQTVTVAADASIEVVLVMEPSKADLVGDRIDLRDTVYFDTAKASIQERSFPLLDDVVSILGDHPELTLLRVEGHTDSRGSAAYNKDLSQRRADAVRQYLLDQGIDDTRVRAVGYGEEKPIDDREVAEAWEKNRRVDFWVEERSD